MRYWLRVRRAWLIGGVLLLPSAIAVLWPSAGVAFPSLGSGGEMLLYSASCVSALAPVVTLNACLDAAGSLLDVASARHAILRALDAVTVLVICAVPLLAWRAFPEASTEILARNTLGFTGVVVALVGLGWRSGSYVVPVVYLVACILFGTSFGQLEPEPWAWILAPAGSTTAWVFAIALFLTGLLLYTAGRRPQPLQG